MESKNKSRPNKGARRKKNYRSVPVEHFYGPNHNSSEARYNAVLNELREYKGQVKKVVEYGAGELTFIDWYFRHPNVAPSELQELHVIDTNLSKTFQKFERMNYDHINKRKEEFKIYAYEGCISSFDKSILGQVDGVVAVEVIEHLYPDILEAVPLNIFGRIRPGIVIMTTPNVEYNKFMDWEGFRHDDHKFEWDRDQFQSWALNICERFKYKVKFLEVGGQFKITGCALSQIGVFTRENDGDLGMRAMDNFGICTKNTKTRFRSKEIKFREVVGIKIPSRDDFIFTKINEYICSNYEIDKDDVSLPLKLLAQCINEMNLIYNDDALMTDEMEIEKILDDRNKSIIVQKIPRKGLVKFFLYR